MKSIGPSSGFLRPPTSSLDWTCSHAFITRGGQSRLRPDLDALWRDPGLTAQGENLELNDGAPLAAIRKSITEPPLR
jgi:hypothetical protein